MGLGATFSLRRPATGTFSQPRWLCYDTGPLNGSHPRREIFPRLFALGREPFRPRLSYLIDLARSGRGCITHRLLASE